MQLLLNWDKVARYEQPGAWVRRVAIRLAMRSMRRERVLGVLRFSLPRPVEPSPTGPRHHRCHRPPARIAAGGRGALLPRGPSHVGDRAHPGLLGTDRAGPPPPWAQTPGGPAGRGGRRPWMNASGGELREQADSHPAGCRDGTRRRRGARHRPAPLARRPVARRCERCGPPRDRRADRLLRRDAHAGRTGHDTITLGRRSRGAVLAGAGRHRRGPRQRPRRDVDPGAASRRRPADDTADTYPGGGQPLSGFSYSVSQGALRTNLFAEPCGSVGAYAWQRSGTGLSFTPTKDDCELRRTLLTTAAWTELR